MGGRREVDDAQTIVRERNTALAIVEVPSIVWPAMSDRVSHAD
jgi:hypothetical protein